MRINSLTKDILRTPGDLCWVPKNLDSLGCEIKCKHHAPTSQEMDIKIVTQQG